MIYENILVDVFNVYHKCKATCHSEEIFDICRKVVDTITDYKKHLNDNGDIYLLFDPIPKSDLGENRVFRLSYRKEIYKDYKSNRKYEANDLKALSFLHSYYKFRGEHVKSVMNCQYEADDFVESLVRDLKKKIALVSTDYDWARYVSDDVHLINNTFDAPFTPDEFIEKFNFKPSVLNLTIYKAIFGDSSDRIPKLSTLKKVFYYDDLDAAAMEMICSFKDTDTLQDILSQIFDYKLTSFMEYDKTTPIQKFAFILNFAEVKAKGSAPAEVFRTNIQLIRCICKDAKPFVRCFKENTAINKALDASIGYGIQKKKIVFGGIKI